MSLSKSDMEHAQRLFLSPEPEYPWETPDVYWSLQEHASDHTQLLSKKFELAVHPIYLEMLWRDRLNNVGGNLFTACPMKGSCSKDNS